MRTRRFPRNASRGFTMIEAVVVIIVLGVLAAMVYSPGSSPLGASRKANADALRSHIRYAQSRAMKSGSTFGINCDGNAYWLFTGNDASVPSALPGETAASVNLAARNVSLTAFTVAFDTAGRPYSDANLATPLSANLSLNLSATDVSGVSVALTLTMETGYVR
ncbi:MAG: GspH/FimT family pseudopilin [Desulfovibrionaceae bacterium]